MESPLQSEFTRLWNLSHSRKEDIYPLRVAGHQFKLRATVDTGSMTSTIAGVTAEYLETHYPKCIRIEHHEARKYSTICKGQGGSYARSATIYFHLGEGSLSTFKFQFAILENMDSLMLLGKNFNDKFNILMDRKRKLVDYQGPD
ncbi:unnamed protein product, partial [Allacma fusca]